MAGTFRHDITAPPASSLDSAPADGGKARNKSAARRQRVRQSARADIAQRLQRHVDLLREKIAAVQQALAARTARRLPSRRHASAGGAALTASPPSRSAGGGSTGAASPALARAPDGEG
jgi:hypothetical protein